MKNKRAKVLIFVLSAMLLLVIGSGAVITYVLALRQNNFISGVTVEYKGKRDVYCVINGSSAVNGANSQNLSSATFNGNTTAPITRNFSNNVTLEEGDTLTFEFTIQNNNTYSERSNLYVLPEISVTLPQNNTTQVTTATQFKIGASGTYATWSDEINNCGYLLVAKNETLYVKHTITVDEDADDVNFTISLGFELNSDTDVPVGYIDFSNATISGGYTLTIQGVGAAAPAEIWVTLANGTKEKWEWNYYYLGESVPLTWRQIAWKGANDNEWNTTSTSLVSGAVINEGSLALQYVVSIDYLSTMLGTYDWQGTAPYAGYSNADYGTSRIDSSNTNMTFPLTLTANTSFIFDD